MADAQSIFPATLPVRFLAKVQHDPVTGCWNWVGAKRRGGYGCFWLNGGQVGAHRFAYEAVHGPLPDGLITDHLCRNPACVNPAHLEPVTWRENIMRGESPCAKASRGRLCRKGHRLFRDKDQRRCLACRRERERARKITAGARVCACGCGKFLPKKGRADRLPMHRSRAPEAKDRGTVTTGPPQNAAAEVVTGSGTCEHLASKPGVAGSNPAGRAT